MKRRGKIKHGRVYEVCSYTISTDTKLQLADVTRKLGISRSEYVELAIKEKLQRDKAQ